MERKLITLVFAALLGGMVGGYGLGYATYPQLHAIDQQMLLNQLDSLATNVGAKPVQKYHESMRISVFDCGSSGAAGSGVSFDSTNKFLFAVNSKGTSMKVTDLWISYTYYSTSSGNLFIYINSNMAASWIQVLMCGSSAPTRQNTVHVTNATIYDLIVFGINAIELEAYQISMQLQALDIFVEYEYLA